MMICAACNTELKDDVKYPSIMWENAARDWFCDYDCRFDFMATKNLRYLNPKPQEDVDENLY